MVSGSTVLLTGVGGKGQVGEAVAAAFARLGASLVLVDRTAANVEARAAELQRDGHAARGYGCDLTDPNDIAALVGTFERITARTFTRSYTWPADSR